MKNILIALISLFFTYFSSFSIASSWVHDNSINIMTDKNENILINETESDDYIYETEFKCDSITVSVYQFDGEAANVYVGDEGFRTIKIRLDDRFLDAYATPTEFSNVLNVSILNTSINVSNLLNSEKLYFSNIIQREAIDLEVDKWNSEIKKFLESCSTLEAESAKKHAYAEEVSAKQDAYAKEVAAMAEAIEKEANQKAAQASRKAAEDKKAQSLAELLGEDTQYQQAMADTVGEQVAGNLDDLLIKLVSEQWQRPPSARNGMSVEVLIEMQRDGTISNASVIRSSGDSPFDSSAVAAVRKVGRIQEMQQLDRATFEAWYRQRRVIFKPEDLSL